jgi:hypothetical protein
MAVVALTNEELAQARQSQELIEYFHVVIATEMNATAALGSLSPANTARWFVWGKEFDRNPAVLFGDNTMMSYIVNRMQSGGIANKETGGGGTLGDQIVAYIDADVNRKNSLVQAYLQEKTKMWA